MNFWELIVNQWQQQSIAEILAVLLAVCYVWLAAQASVWCWPAGFMSTALFAYIYWDVTYVFQMLLNVYYMAMAIWGFISWRRQGNDKVKISKLRWRQHFYSVIFGAVVSLIVYLIARQWLNYNLVFLDIALTVFSLIATYLTVIKKLENWWYWSVINGMSIFLLLEKELYLTVVLMLIYLVLAVRGFVYWRKLYRRENSCEA